MGETAKPMTGKEMADSPRVSVIVPLFDKEPTVEAALRSIATQTLIDLEIIVVNDGSRDSGPALVRSFPDPRIRMINQDNAGPGAARNRGIAEARCPYVAFLDADDEWMPHFLDQALQYLDDDPSLGAVTFAWLDHPGAVSSVDHFRRRGLSAGLQPVSPDLDPSLLVTMVNFMWPVSTVARAGVIRRVGGFYENGARYGEDLHLWTKVLLNAPVYFVMEPAAHYHHEASGLSGNRRSMRPVEPFLTDPEDLRGVCPERSRDLLERFLCLRALKTSSILGYWGRGREGAAIRRRFFHPACRKATLNLLSHLATTPLGALAGRLDRWRKGIA